MNRLLIVLVFIGLVSGLPTPSLIYPNGGITELTDHPDIPLEEQIGQLIASALERDEVDLPLEIVVQVKPQTPAPAKTRVRRQLSGGVDHTSGGTRVHGAASAPIWKGSEAAVNANGHWERTYRIPSVGTGPAIYGGGVSYDHRTRGGAGVDVTRTPAGTQLNVDGRGTVWQSGDRNTRVDAHGTYSRNYGGPYGTGRPSYGVGATFTHKFG